jgi:hypothetical protein
MHMRMYAGLPFFPLPFRVSVLFHVSSDEGLAPCHGTKQWERILSSWPVDRWRLGELELLLVFASQHHNS